MPACLRLHTTSLSSRPDANGPPRRRNEKPWWLRRQHRSGTGSPQPTPGLLRLAAGLRAVLGLTLTLAALTVLDQPSVVLLAGGFTAVVTSSAISDLHPRDQFRTLLAGAPVASPP